MNWEKILDSVAELGTTAGAKILYALLILLIGLKVSKWIVKKLSAVAPAKPGRCECVAFSA